VGSRVDDWIYWNFSITITVDYNSSHNELLLDNESLIAFFLDLGQVSSLLLLGTTDGFSATTDSIQSETESELLCDWRFTANQFVLAPNSLRLTSRIFLT
jgi:hypothetical protein